MARKSRFGPLSATIRNAIFKRFLFHFCHQIKKIYDFRLKRFVELKIESKKSIISAMLSYLYLIKPTQDWIMNEAYDFCVYFCSLANVNAMIDQPSNR